MHIFKTMNMLFLIIFPNEYVNTQDKTVKQIPTLKVMPHVFVHELL